MARADLLKRLFQSYQQRDDQGFLTAAEEIIQEEQRKHHVSVANQLRSALQMNSSLLSNGHTLQEFGAVPKDIEKGVPLIEIRRPDRYLPDLILSRSVVQALGTVMSEFQSWEILEANGLRPVRHVLFCGPPGCGKTASAEAIASELGLPLLYVRFDAVVSSLLGETSANLRRIFEYASRGQWVILFDEFDAIGRSRDDLSEHGEIKRVVNSFLQLMDGFHSRSLVLSATNFEDSLDPAIWRRFDDVVRFERPTMQDIKRLIRLRLSPIHYTEAQVETLSSSLIGAAHSDVERLCFDIRKALAISGERRLTEQRLTDALERWKHRRRAMEGMASFGPHHVDRD